MALIEVVVKPRATETKILSVDGNVYTIAVRAPAEGDKANIALLNFLKKHFGQHVTLVRGRTARRKFIRLD
ncbi:MAG TPA: DUF167 domain-containing protein [Candidatus Nanoarchaeia archaeon]|nr:DUF167 domain-containing protein [Candidatus Nanoarchaeia archaeon]